MPWIVPLVFLALIGWQLHHGVVLGGDWKPWLTRAKQPKRFWAVVAAQACMAGVVVVGLLAIK